MAGRDDETPRASGAHGAAALIDDPPPPGVRRIRRDRAVDVLFAGTALAWWGLAFSLDVGARTPAPPAVRLLDYAIGLTSCVLLWWRRRWPVAVALAAVPVGVFSLTGTVAATLATFTVAVHRRAAVAAAVGAASAAALPFIYLVRTGDQAPPLSSLVISLLFTTVVVALGIIVRGRRELLASLRERAERAEAEQHSRIEQARRTERARIAREMHDVLAHRISLVSLHAGALEFRPDAPPEEIQLAAGVIRAGAHQALQELREVIGLLREDGPAARDVPPVRPQPALSDIPQLVREATDAGEHVRYRCAVVDAGNVPAAIGRTAYRIVQESLTNARKHAPSAEVHLRLDGERGRGLHVKVVNRLPPRGRPAEVPGAGLGLVGLTERVELAGGRLEHGIRPDGSFALEAWLPWPP